MSNGYTPDDRDILRAALASGQNTSGEGPPQEIVDALQSNGYISQQQARNPSSIPWKNGAPDWSDPQFKGLPPLTANSAPDRAAAATATAAAPDLRYGSGSGATVNRAPPPGAPPGQPQVPALTATPFIPNMNAGGEDDEDRGMQPPRPTVLPEHWVNTMAPEDRPKLEAGQQGQIKGVEDQASAESQAADEIGAIAQRGSEDQRFQMMRDEREMKRQQSAIDTHMQELQDRADRISKMQIDPMHVFGEKGSEERTGKQIIAGIAAGLGAAGAALSHGENSAGKIIQSKIDAEIAAQQHNIQNSKEGLETQKGLLADKLKIFGNLPQAQAATRQEMLQATAAEIDATAKKYQSPVIQARAEQMKGELMQQWAQEGLKIKEYVKPQMIGGGANYGVSDVKPDEVMTLSDGRQVTVPTSDREKVVAAQRAAETVKGAADSMRNLLRTPIEQRVANWASWSAAYDAAREVLASAETQAGGKGGKGIIEMNMNAAGARHLVLAPGADKALDQLVAGAQRTAQSSIENSAQYEVEPQLTVDPRTGEQQRKYRIRGQYRRQPPQDQAIPGFKPVGST